MDWNIALDIDNHTIVDGGTAAESGIIYIPAGKVALLSLYNMTASVDMSSDRNAISTDDCAEINKLSFGAAPELAKEINCGETRNLSRELRQALDARRVFKEPVTQCGQTWTIHPCNNFVLIPTPGFYSVKLYDVDQIDTAYIEYLLIDVEDASVIPDSFKLGYGDACSPGPTFSEER